MAAIACALFAIGSVAVEARAGTTPLPGPSVTSRGPLDSRLLTGSRMTWPPSRVPRFLGTQALTVIGSVYDQAGDPATLDGWYMKRFMSRASAGWVACLLEAAGVVQIDRRPPAWARMEPGSR
jgi:hypothetical protein